jgi:hypothetical protein
MSDEREAMNAALQALLNPPSLRVLHKAIIVDQNGGTVGVKMPGSDAPSATAKPAPVWFGLPGFSGTFGQDTETSIGFHEGKESGAFAASFPYYQSGSPIPLLSFGGGTLPIARKTDTTANGRFHFRQTPVGPMGVPSILAISYQEQDGPEIPILTFPIPGPAIMLALDPESPDPTHAIVDIIGVITSGREELKA